MQTHTLLFTRTILALFCASILFQVRTEAATKTVDSGKTVTFGVAASGTAPFSYQWRKDGTAIPGATTASYMIAGTTTAHSGVYTVVVSNGAGTTVSDNATLTVNPPVIAPAITKQPVSVTVTEGSAATFSVTASGTAPNYQWRKNGTAISGATASSYSISATTLSSAGSYTVTVSNSAGSVTSSAASLTVNALVVAPAISQQPVSQSVIEGNTAVFYVTATGTTLSYQWMKNGAPLLGATGSSLTLSGTVLSDAGQYAVVVSNSAGSVTSTTASLAVAALIVPPSIVTQPASQTVTEGDGVTFAVVAGGTAPSYQWLKNGAAISGATGSSFTISSAASADAGSYSVIVSNSAGQVASGGATLTVNPALDFTELKPASFSARGQTGTGTAVGMLFDSNPNTKWVDNSANTWVKVVFSSPTVLDAYSLTSANDAADRDPRSWTLSGSNDGTTWTVVDVRNSQTWASRLLPRDFVLPARSAAFTQYRFDFVSSGGSATQLAEIELYGATLRIEQLWPRTYSARGQASSSTAVSKLFDGYTATKWQDNRNTSWVKIEWSAPSYATRYTLTSAPDNAKYDPVSWTFSGSYDGVTWTVLDTRSGEKWSSRQLRREFTVAGGAKKYLWYRFDFKCASGYNRIQLSEVQIYGSE